jgi:hypothetical protein
MVKNLKCKAQGARLKVKRQKSDVRYKRSANRTMDKGKRLKVKGKKVHSSRFSVNAAGSLASLEAGRLKEHSQRSKLQG